ncbi:MAG: rhodanese-like domain-containing protein [Longimicrobiales bacterium]
MHCRSGGRSARAAATLREAGFSRVLDLEGGLLAWIEQVEPSMPE